MNQFFFFFQTGIVDEDGSVDTFKNKEASRGNPDNAVFTNDFTNIFEWTRATHYGHRQTDWFSYFIYQIKVKTFHNAFVVNGIYDNFTRPVCFHEFGKFDEVFARFLFSVVNKQFVFAEKTRFFYV